jgi:hypothetical protein
MSNKLNVTGAVLVSLTISEFGNNKRDETATQDVVERNQLADATVARVWKTLLPKGSAIDQVRTAISALRSFHYKNTHSYVHDGPRILTTKNFAEYQKGLRQLEDEFQKAVLNLVADFEALKASAQHKLGNLFKDSDYPTSEELQNAYRVSVIYSPLPATDNLLDLGLEPADMAKMRAQLEQELQATFQSANRRMWAELHDRLATVVSQMSNEKSSVHPKTLEGITSLVEMLPRMNLTNDEALDAMSQRLTSMLQAMQSQAFRHDTELKSKVASEARAVFGVMSSFMNAKRRTPQAMEMRVAQA